MECNSKHTKYQPTDEEWRCPKCGSDSKHFYIEYEAIEAMSMNGIVGAKIFEIELPKGSRDFIRNQLMGKIPPIKAVNVAVVEE